MTATISITSSSGQINEDAGFATVTVTRSFDTAGIDLVNYDVIEGAAREWEDYGAVTDDGDNLFRQLVFRAGETQHVIRIGIFDDDVGEANEDFTVRLVSSGTANIGFNEANIVIVDNDGGIGTPSTYTGTDGNDTIVGGDRTDVTDSITGLAGDDVLSGNAGPDVIYGNTGNDQLLGGSEADSLYGGRGDDSLFGGTDGDLLYGNVGSDQLHGGQGEDTLYGGQDGDTLDGDRDDDLLNGDRGDDSLNGGEGWDTLSGGPGADSLTGGANPDRFNFSSGDGVDTITDFSLAEGDIVAVKQGANGISYTSAADLLSRLSTNAQGYAVVDLGGGNSVTLVGIAPSQLTGASFLIF